MDPQPETDIPESHWPAGIAILAVGGLYLALPEALAVGPRWLQLVVVIILLVPTEIANYRGKAKANHFLGLVVTCVVTIFMTWSLVLLLKAVPAHKEMPTTMLRSAVALWITNILVFATWYWRLDVGGPHGRDLVPGHPNGSFLFPQMTLADKGDVDGGPWARNFVDYLFLALNSSTAFSPTDAPILSRWAKVLTMIQATISLSVVVVLAARAVNIL